jgi:hypothetical protein
MDSTLDHHRNSWRRERAVRTRQICLGSDRTEAWRIGPVPRIPDPEPDNERVHKRNDWQNGYKSKQSADDPDASGQEDNGSCED